MDSSQFLERLHRASVNLARVLFMFTDLSNPETFRDLSKPVGALNQERLERLLVCMWGSWLLRNLTSHSLCLLSDLGVLWQGVLSPLLP